jgi:outer membrane protein OmpA-like peptidoglycan-associated protein
MAFDSALTKIIFTRNNVIKRTKTSEEGIIKLNLFESTITNNVFGKATRLPFNSPEYSCGHPTLTKDGKFMIFASDMPGGKGGQDLYYTEYSAGTWSEPVNLGSDINTESDEVFPFLHEDGTLYYASDGLPGLGGLDVYVAQKTADKQWGFPKNFGAPINSQDDDFAFIYNKEKNSGYFSSNRPKGKGDDDIYFFDNRQFLLKVYVYDKLTGEPIEGSMVRLAENGDTILTQNTDNKGYTIFKTPKGPTYVFKASKAGYKDNYVEFNSGEAPTDTVKIPLMRNGFILEALVVDKVTQQPIEGALVIVKNDKTKDVDSTSLTAMNGKAYPFILANNNFTVKADKFGYFLVSPVAVSTYDIVGDTIKVKLELSYLSAGAIVKLENIYYDFDKFNIRKDAGEELDRLVEIMQKYPKMKIEMRSHTDSRGSDAYNMKLSQNRANSAAKYLVKEGIAQVRIAFKGYGETVPVNNCTNDYPCSEAEHQLNRRTEFKVLVQPDGTEVKGTIQ